MLGDLFRGIRNLLRGKRIVPVPNSHWTKFADMDRPLGDTCACGGQLYFAKGSINEAVCTSCGLLHLLVLVTDPDAEVMIEEYRKEHMLKL